MLPEKVTRFLNQTELKMTFYVEKGAIEKYVDAVDDPNPIYWNEDYAKKSKYGSLTAPPGFYGWPSIMKMKTENRPLPLAIGGELAQALAEVGYGRVVNGTMAFEFFQPVYAGDVLTSEAVIESIVEKEGRSGRMVFVTTKRAYYNGKGEKVATQSHTTVHR